MAEMNDAQRCPQCGAVICLPHLADKCRNKPCPMRGLFIDAMWDNAIDGRLAIERGIEFEDQEAALVKSFRDFMAAK